MSSLRLRRYWFAQWAGLVAASVLVVAGCNPGGYSGPTGTVSGKLTLNGQPAPAGCGVAFVSDQGFTALGTAGADGAYSLASAGKSDIPVATYKVTVSAPSQGGTMSDADYDKMMSGDPDAAKAATAAPPVVPPKFADPSTSGLSFDVKEGPNTIDIDLK